MLASRVGRKVAGPVVQSTRGAARGFKILNEGADMSVFKGVKADHKPASVQLEAGKKYFWCACGLSSNQPFCDGSHKPDGLTMAKPVEFEVERTGTYLLCNCKQTASRPLCDGSHKNVSKRPLNADARQKVAFSSDRPIYEGVARKLGLKQKDGGWHMP
ncbi:hypothetical protein WR25_02007 [Diploscapter pachys]|uniref:Iron-binding zinc finger CDGSH type domain-containing protein n=1 Tax=Diploscapter pachys TaxID=2018661 RepID=A0A2A2JNC3_9BILA|nr:hypothetical protein WR25_02007 [Diploscapter pachys]